jgi:hypothetical protein
MLITNPKEPHMALDDGGAMPAHPGDPPALPTSTEDADIAAWHRAMDYYRARLDAYRVSLEPQRIAAAEKHGQGQADTAVEMGRYTAMMREFMAPAAPSPEPAPEPIPEPTDRAALLSAAVAGLDAYFASVRP